MGEQKRIELRQEQNSTGQMFNFHSSISSIQRDLRGNVNSKQTEWIHPYGITSGCNPHGISLGLALFTPRGLSCCPPLSRSKNDKDIQNSLGNSPQSCRKLSSMMPRVPRFLQENVGGCEERKVLIAHHGPGVVLGIDHTVTSSHMQDLV